MGLGRLWREVAAQRPERTERPDRSTIEAGGRKWSALHREPVAVQTAGLDSAQSKPLS